VLEMVHYHGFSHHFLGSRLFLYTVTQPDENMTDHINELTQQDLVKCSIT